MSICPPVAGGQAWGSVHGRGSVQAEEALRQAEGALTDVADVDDVKGLLGLFRLHLLGQVAARLHLVRGTGGQGGWGTSVGLASKT